MGSELRGRCTIDVGVGNFEYLDVGDAFDLAIMNTEIVEDPPSSTNVDIGSGAPMPCGVIPGCGARCGGQCVYVPTG